MRVKVVGGSVCLERERGRVYREREGEMESVCREREGVCFEIEGVCREIESACNGKCVERTGRSVF